MHMPYPKCGIPEAVVGGNKDEETIAARDDEVDEREKPRAGKPDNSVGEHGGTNRLVEHVRCDGFRPFLGH